MLTLKSVLFLAFLYCGLATSRRKTGIGLIESVTFSNLTLKLNWISTEKTSVKMTIKEEQSCIYEGFLESEPNSKVLVTGCRNNSFDVQIHSSQFQDMMFSTKNGTHIPMEGLDDQFLTAERDSRSASDDFFEDYVNDFNFYDEFPDYSEAETDVDIQPPASLVLPVNIYLDPNWMTYHKAYAEETARQTVRQASLILNHVSLDTKINLMPSVQLYKIQEHVEPNRKGFEKFGPLLQQPFTRHGSAVAHILLTVNDSSYFIGIGRIKSICSSTVKPMAIAKWKLNSPRTALTLAHEIGHILGMHHDFLPVGDKRGKCGEGKRKGTLIMNYGEPRQVWSRCSNQDFRRLYQAVVFKNHKFCLKTPDEISDSKSGQQLFDQPTVITTTTTTAKPSGWGQWEAWSQCSKNCGVGKWTRSKHCTGPTCSHFTRSQERYCNTHPC